MSYQVFLRVRVSFFLSFFPCLLVGAIPPGFATARENADADDATQRLVRLFNSPRWIFDQDAQERPLYRALWKGKATWMNMRILYRMGAAEELGLSEEQQRTFAYLHKENELGVDLIRTMHEENDPVFFDLMGKTQQALKPGDPDFLAATEEEKEAYRQASENFFTYIFDAMNREVEEGLTEEQKTNLRAIEIQVLPELGFASPGMFEPLGLSEEQKADMEEIAKSLDPIFETLLDDTMTARRDILAQIGKDLAEASGKKAFASEKELFEARNEAHRKAASDPEFRKKLEVLKQRGRNFATDLKEKLMNVLTDEQLDRMQDILDRTPESIRTRLTAMRKAREEEEKSQQWTPGPNSWRPGEGTPAEFKEKRKSGRFPTPK